MRKKKLKSVLVVGLVLGLTLSSSVFAESVSENVSKETVTFYSDNSSSVPEKLISLAKIDSDANSILKNYTIEQKSKTELATNVLSSPIIISYKDFEKDSKSNFLIEKLIEKKEDVFVYGNDLKIAQINEKFNLRNNHTSSEEGYNIIGIVNGVVSFTSNITAEDENGISIPITSDMVVQNVLRYLENSKTSPEPIDTSFGNKQTKKDEATDESKKMKSEDSTDDTLVSPMSYGSDTIVQSSYNNSSTYYSPDAWGNNILRASLNTDWILKRNTSDDTDPNKDYFYVRDNTELYTNQGKAANGWGIHVEHTLPYASADNVLEWDPDTTTDASTVAVSLPWAVQWQFNVGQNALDIYTNGSQTTDKITWDVLNNALGFREVFDGDYNRIQPGTAWASSGTLAAINVKNVGSFKYGVQYHELTQNFNIRYDY